MIGRRTIFIVPLIAILAIAAYDGYYLLRVPVAVGLDGYYYQLQLTNLLHTGKLYFPSSTPLLFYISYVLDIAVNDPVLTIKILSIFLHTSLCLALFLNVFEITRNVWLATFSPILVTVSGLHFFFVGEFLKNLAAVMFIAWAGYCLQKVADKGKRFWILSASLLLLLAFLSHKSSLVIVPLLVIVFLVLRILVPEKSSSKHQLLPLLLLFLIWSSPLILKLQPILQPSASMLAEVTGGGRWIFLPLPVTLVLVAVTVATIYVVTLARERLPRRTVVFMTLIAAWSALISVNPLLKPTGDWDSAFNRLKALAHIQVALLAPCLIWLIQLSGRRFNSYAVWAIVVVVVCIYSGPPASMSDAFLKRRTNIIQHLPEFRENLGTDPIVIATHGDQFVVSSVLGISSQKEWPNTKYASTYWLLNMVPEDRLPPHSFILAKEFTDDYKREIHVRENTAVYSIMVLNEDLMPFLESLSKEKRSWVLSFNPHLARYLAG